ncbi:hypothetical protein NPIL_586901, partial [Nephila pilipes]
MQKISTSTYSKGGCSELVHDDCLDNIDNDREFKSQFDLVEEY